MSDSAPQLTLAVGDRVVYPNQGVCKVFAVDAMVTGSPRRGLLYLVLAVAAFLLIQRNLRADERLAADVDTPLEPRLRFESGK